MSTIIEHVRHRVAGPHPDERLMLTICGLRFVATRSARDFERHEPETSRCRKCYA